MRNTFIWFLLERPPFHYMFVIFTYMLVYAKIIYSKIMGQSSVMTMECCVWNVSAWKLILQPQKKKTCGFASFLDATWASSEYSSKGWIYIQHNNVASLLIYMVYVYVIVALLFMPSLIITFKVLWKFESSQDCWIARITKWLCTG